MDTIITKQSKILITDDDPEIREVVRLMLEGEGYTVFEAEDGDGAIRILREEKASIW